MKKETAENQSNERVQWLTLIFALPNSPSRVRVSIWRKLKKSGALNLSQATWMLPVRAECRADFQAIAEEVEQSGGETWLMESVFTDLDQEAALIARFNEERQPEYAEFLEKCEDLLNELARETEAKKFTYAELEENDELHVRLSDWLSKIRQRDFFDSSYGITATEQWQRCEKELDIFAENVYAAAEKGSI